MSMIIDGTDGLTFNDSSTQNVTALNASNINAGTLGKARLPTGSVLQVINATYATQTTNSTGTYADTGLSASITPTSSSSKILVLVNQCGVAKGPGSADQGVNFRLLRGASSILVFQQVATYNNSSSYNYVGSVSTCYLDSPATTSSTTYKTQFNNNVATGTSYVQVVNGADPSTSTITLLEIAA